MNWTAARTWLTRVQTSDGWFVKIKLDDPAELENLMDERQL